MEFTYIDLFAGCGGLSLGLHLAGWKGLFAIEKSEQAFSTLKFNLFDNKKHFNWPEEWLGVKEHDINNVIKNQKEELLKLRGTIDLVAGGPPCQGFSTAGKRNENDHRNELINSYIEFINIVSPKLVFFENVKGFTQRFEKNKSKGLKYSEYVKQQLENINYSVYGELVDFSEFGVPQKRVRYILIGVKKENKPKITINPKAFFENIALNKQQFFEKKGLPSHSTVKSALSDLLKANGTKICSDSSIKFLSGIYGKATTKYQKIMRENLLKESTPNSHRFANHNEETMALFSLLLQKAPKGKKADKKTFDLKRRSIIVLDENEPALTITSHPDDYLHYCEPRILTVRECARLQSFPDWYEFKSKYTTGGILRKTEVPRYTQVGNAIPPLFSEQAGLALIQMLENESKL